MRVKGVRSKFGDNFLVEAHRKDRLNRGNLFPETKAKAHPRTAFTKTLSSWVYRIRNPFYGYVKGDH
jgi:hypothetical protein